MSPIIFPDVSNHNRGLIIQPGTPFVWAKATEGTTFKDDTYAGFKAQADKVGAHFGAYHFLHAGSGAAQAEFCFSVVGKGIPLFVDAEPTGSSRPTLADVEAFTARYRALGGTCKVMYLPKWYWSSLGSPSLVPAGLKLISSGYPAGYSDTSANWDPYGGVTPFQWQFSDSYEYGGMRIDMNAYKGTINQYLAAIGIPVASPPPATTIQEDDMAYLISVTPDPTQAAGNTNQGIFVVDDKVVHVDKVSFPAYKAKLGNPLVVDTAQYEALVSAKNA